MKFVGIDIGSTCAKTVVLDEAGEPENLFVIPTGWSSFDALEKIRKQLLEAGVSDTDAYTVSTGYGRKAVPFAQKQVTEITCHARGAAALFGEGEMNLIDIGGQDTKVISARGGLVEEFYMNDKCSAGTGKFIEIMANRLELPIAKLDEIAEKRTKEVQISSMCTVFAESEIVSMVGQGTSKENIAWGVLNSVANKVQQEYGKLRDGDRPVYLTGGLCEASFFLRMLSDKLGGKVTSCKRARYAGALGAAFLAYEKYGETRT